MQLYGALILFATVSTVYGLQCYSCERAKPQSCKEKTVTCDSTHDQCFTTEKEGLMTKGCGNEPECGKPTKCCKGDLCNNAVPAVPSILLLLLSSALIKLFI
ncbi:lymphocyte antigen 6C2-like [Cololabis saira]|uniref:lymphocyte antigen 6C2-like n=1 Tax=Cololabis saira TaxID=129043 RepID=UPI002AD2054B|nr:lymphocyte antigen 6C2-like [Cololabis saira]